MYILLHKHYGYSRDPYVACICVCVVCVCVCGRRIHICCTQCVVAILQRTTTDKRLVFVSCVCMYKYV